MKALDRVRAAYKGMFSELLTLAELVGYVVLFGMVAHFVQTVPWYDALTGMTFVLIMVVRRFRRWLGKGGESDRTV
jgi:hypothetical protein